MNDIINILNQVRIVSRKIKEQRKEKFERGENYNIFNDLGFMSDEVHLHSMFLANLLNPKGSHGQRGKFLEAFLKMLQKSFPAISADNLELDTAIASVGVEKYIGRQTDSEGGRIDIYLTDGKHSIIIENKIYASDQHHQMLRYWNYGMSQKGDDTEKSFVLIYLTLDGCSPSKDSLGEDLKENDIVCLSYKNDIRGWLDRCVELASRTPLVRETINQYISTIDILTNNVMEDNKELLDILCKEENLDAVFDIIYSKENLINHIINDEFIRRSLNFPWQAPEVLTKRWCNMIQDSTNFCTFAPMKKEPTTINKDFIISFFLPDGMTDWFEIVGMREEPNGGTAQADVLYSSVLHIYLDERDNRIGDQLGLKPNGFTEATVIKDYPIRNRKVLLHVRRRRYLDADGRNIILNQYPLTADGTKLSVEFGLFFKDGDGQPSVDGSVIGKILSY